MARPISRLQVRRALGAPHRGKLIAAGRALPCALGAAGVSACKREGDGATPRGVFPLLELWRRPDRPIIRTLLAHRRIRPDDGWCDAPSHRLYNRPVRLPFPTSCDRMWRDDALYDLVVDIAWNRGPVVRGRGSAIFMHAARPGFGPTEGCVALSARNLRKLLGRLAKDVRIDIR